MTDATDVADATKTEPVSNDVSNMKDGDIKWRSKYKASVAEKEEISRKLEKIESERNSMAQQAETNLKAASDRMIQAELKALVVSEGIKDIDVAKLIDISTVKVDDKGNLIGLKEAVSEFKTKKPDFFGTNKMQSSSSNAAVPHQSEPTRVDARALSRDDYEVEKRKLLYGR